MFIFKDVGSSFKDYGSSRLVPYWHIPKHVFIICDLCKDNQSTSIVHMRLVLGFVFLCSLQCWVYPVFVQDIVAIYLLKILIIHGPQAYRVARTSRDLPISRNLQTFSMGLFQEVKWAPKWIICAKNLI